MQQENNRCQIADLDGGGEGGLGLDGLELLPAVLVGLVEGVGVLGLGADHAGHAGDEAQVAAHLEALVEGVDVAQVASWDDDPVRHLHPIHSCLASGSIAYEG